MSSASMSPSPSTAPVPPSSAKQRRKPGPKPKAKPPVATPTTAVTPSPSLIIKLKIDQDKLRTLTTFPPPPAPSPIENDAPSGSPPSGENSARTTPPAAETPSSAAATTAGTKRRAGPGPASKAGNAPKRVRTSGIGTGPKLGGRKKGPLAGVAATGAVGSAAPKLGPKSNMGAINDKLRALDRTGRPCKRWTKTGFTLKSFTGVQWEIPTWGTSISQAGQDQPPDGTSHGVGINSETASAEPSVSAGTPPDIQIHDFDTPHSSTPAVLPPGIAI